MIPKTVQANTVGYNINLTMYDNNTYDWDEIVCMNQQIYAISQGWADPIKVFVVDEIPPMFYEWRNPAFDFLNKPEEDTYKPSDGEPIKD